ncbi:hypothetical protein T459_03583 [Capsicum annuum]|uniref:Uncharacterized protein n=1 Tax=Capsicum annuum TaxID=4072 RepID=A0A2G3AN91_CAPAN|nr:hypothetical protein T459_03583 [Capsicum annuum]
MGLRDVRWLPEEGTSSVQSQHLHRIPCHLQNLHRRDPLSWENPEEYRPERFLNNDTDVKGLNFELILFEDGRRGCPGITFGIAVIELALARLVHKFNFALPQGIKTEDLDMTESIGITTRRKSPLLVAVSSVASS